MMSDKITVEWSDANDETSEKRRIEIDKKKIAFDPEGDGEAESVESLLDEIYKYRQVGDFWDAGIEGEVENPEDFQPDPAVRCCSVGWDDVLKDGGSLQAVRYWDRYIPRSDDYETYCQSFDIKVSLYDGDRKLRKKDLFEKGNYKGGR